MDQHHCEAAPSPQGDDGGSAFDKLWWTLLDMVQHKFWWLDRARIEDAVMEVIARRLKLDDDFRRTMMEGKGEEVARSLYSAACREVGKGLREEGRRRRREQEYARRKKICSPENLFVQNVLSAGNISLEEQREELERLLEECAEWERAFVVLRIEGIKDLTAYAELLGTAHCSLEEQKRAVKRAWNRIRMKLRRLQTRQR